MTNIVSLSESVDTATETFRTFTEGQPDLIPIGVNLVDEEVGGLGPGTSAIIGANNGLGKSSVILDACLVNQDNGVKTAYISLEDGRDVFGCRLLARYSGVDSRKIRKKSFTPEEEKALRVGHKRLQDAAKTDAAMVTLYGIGKPLEDVCDLIREAADVGAKIVYIDYIQKIRGVREDRRNEVATAFSRLHGTADRCGVAAVFASQISRQIDYKRIPTRHALKETGDLENEARMIIMLGRLDENRDHVWGNLDKSTFGGEGLQLRWLRKECGSLYQVSQFDNEDGF